MAGLRKNDVMAVLVSREADAWAAVVAACPVESARLQEAIGAREDMEAYVARQAGGRDAARPEAEEPQAEGEKGASDGN
jgi:hypothetical protein